jgi:prefoldin alpha subunit
MSTEASNIEDQVNTLAYEVRILESTFNELTSRQNLLERALLENRAAQEALKQLSQQKPEETLIQLGGGTLVRSPPPSIDKVLVNVGSNVVIEKPKDEAVAILEERAKDVEKSIVSLIRQRNEVAQRVDADRQALQSLLTRQGGQKSQS